jgi:hypothetical protein
MMLMNKKTWINRVRDVAGWITIAAFITMFIAQGRLDSMNPQGNGPWPELLPRPKSFNVWLSIRNASLLVALLTGIASLPSWQSLVGLALTMVFFLWEYWLFATY